MLGRMVEFDCVVVGGGIHGLCTAFWLAWRGLPRLLVVEQGAPGHTSGSSHGATRITRSSYDDPKFVAMAQRAHAEGWPALEAALGKPLRVRTPGVFFGPARGLFAAWQRATLQTGVAVEALELDAARARFPLLRFDAGDAVLLDHTAAMVLAAETMAGLRTWLAARGVTFAFDTRVTRRQETATAIELSTTTGTIRANHAVLACGAWLPLLENALAAQLVVQRQEVAYVDVEADPAAQRAGVFPVWARIGTEPNDFQYGLPSHDDAGLKLAVHRSAGPGVDPDALPPPIDEGALRTLARERLRPAVRTLRRTERCLYTMTADQDFRIVTHRRTTTVLACSGHAFKFGPVVGQDAAAATLAALGR